MSPLIRLYFKVGNFNRRSLSLYVKCLLSVGSAHMQSVYLTVDKLQYIINDKTLY